MGSRAWTLLTQTNFLPAPLRKDLEASIINILRQEKIRPAVKPDSKSRGPSTAGTCFKRQRQTLLGLPRLRHPPRRLLLYHRPQLPPRHAQVDCRELGSGRKTRERPQDDKVVNAVAALCSILWLTWCFAWSPPWEQLVESSTAFLGAYRCWK